MKILAAIFIILFAYCGISLATIIKNGVSLNDQPGIIARLKIFLTTHRAETAYDASFKELKTPVYKNTSDEAIIAIKQAAKKMGWTIAENSHSTPTELHYVVTTALLKFKDDISISTESNNEGQVSINIQSESRVGTADFGANLRHITELINELDEILKK